MKKKYLATFLLSFLLAFLVVYFSLRYFLSVEVPERLDERAGTEKDSDNPLYHHDNAGRWPVIAKNSTTYVLYYGFAEPTYPDEIHMATSTDGENFTYYGESDTLKIQPGTWLSDGLEIHTVVYNYNSSHHIAYVGGFNSTSHWNIGAFFTENLINFTEYDNNPIISADSTDNRCSDPSGVRLSNGTYLVYYVSSISETFGISVASSSDGITFTKYNDGNQILTTGDYDWCSNRLGVTGALEDDNGTIWLLVTAKAADGITDNAILRSNDGVNFEEDPGISNPFLAAGDSGQWDDSGVLHSDFEIIGSDTYIYYCGYDGSNLKFGRALWTKTSDDSGQDVYICYGKNDAATTSNGGNACVFFDDFETDSSKWNVLESAEKFEEKCQ